MKRLTQLHHHIRRNSLTIGFSVIALALGTILYIQASALSQLQAELKNQQVIIGQVKVIGDQIKANGEERSKQIDNINRHMDCIVTFFSQPDRSTKAIADINTCALQANASAAANPTTAPQPAVSGGTQTPSDTKNGTSQNNSNGGSASGGSAQPGFFQRNIIQPIKNLINGL